MKKFILTLFIFFLTSCEMPTNYESGMIYYKESNYLVADEYFKKVNKEEKEYNQALDMIALIKPFVDSLQIIQDSIRQVELEREREKNIQIEFESARYKFYKQYKDAENEIRQSNIFNDSRAHTCVFYKKYGSAFKNWSGIVKTISTDQGGDEVFFEIVSKDQNIKIEYSDILKRKDRLYNYISTLKEGDKVNFSFTFSKEGISTNVDECFNETSFTELGSLEEPEFSVIFNSISKIL
jgi:hypothetical protein